LHESDIIANDKAPASMPAALASNLAPMRTEQKAGQRLNLCVELEVKAYDFPDGG
jgi:hypothetical protein